ncbi:phage tail sheath family protein [Paenibacillus sp. L3-i20]|uniref:phage tail sheath family protein n=1 Tax=Paenibacillus sp. L3-i20 TaxID=2905833 RepID=UPI001EDD1DB1|nr:phage tail sheath family protein [Paenibacillus sp. L3-i20]GKU79858.1 hypothetical protein L3i20_v242550 [Paenibacillus sp. L3-i20]
MASGNWTTTNKERPGVYVNFTSEPQPLGTVGDRGVVTIPLVMSWGPAKTVIAVDAGADTFSTLGYSLATSEMLLIRESLKRAKRLLLYRLNAGTNATATLGTLTMTAKYGGIRGNDIRIVSAANVDQAGTFDVMTYVSGALVDEQIKVPNVGALKANDWVNFSGTGALSASAGVPLQGGSNGTTTNADFTDYMAAIEIHNFDTLAYTGVDATLKGIFTSFCKRLRDVEGKKLQTVLENYPTADYEGVISVKNGVVLADGTTLTAAQATAWVAGATAGAQINQSLTYSAYDGAVDVSPRYTHSQIVAALQAGEFVFTLSNQRAIVEQDINSLKSFTPAKGKQFGKNRVIRVLDGINNDFVRIFSDFYLGKVSNNADGRNLLKGDCIKHMELLQRIEAVENFDSQTDITVSVADGQSDGVYIESYVQPVDSIEKIYVLVKVGGAA